jgi:hypothetical protein
MPCRQALMKIPVCSNTLTVLSEIVLAVLQLSVHAVSEISAGLAPPDVLLVTARVPGRSRTSSLNMSTSSGCIKYDVVKMRSSACPEPSTRFNELLPSMLSILTGIKVGSFSCCSVVHVSPSYNNDKYLPCGYMQGTSEACANEGYHASMQC